jgi:CubicO group peptidase (beta-lactamase class C family)
MTAAAPDEHIRSFENDPYDFDPGAKWSYSNSGYFLLGYIVGKFSRQSYAEFLKEQFFDPLGMRFTLPMRSSRTRRRATRRRATPSRRPRTGT